MEQNKEIKALGAKMKFTAEIELEDGTIVKKVVEVDGGVPSEKEMDLTSIDGFLKSFDKYERGVIEARNRIAEEITEEYFNALSKKKTDKTN